MIKMLMLSFLFLGYMCARKEKPVTAVLPVKMDTVNVESSPVTYFESDIKPIFMNHCQPCHFPGGKMYEKMPFDKPQTIRDHSTGIFRRIKDPKDVEKLKLFLEKVSS